MESEHVIERDRLPALGRAVQCGVSMKKVKGCLHSLGLCHSCILLQDQYEQAGYTKPTAEWVFEEAESISKRIMNDILNTLSRLLIVKNEMINF